MIIIFIVCIAIIFTIFVADVTDLKFNSYRYVILSCNANETAFVRNTCIIPTACIEYNRIE